MANTSKGRRSRKRRPDAARAAAKAAAAKPAAAKPAAAESAPSGTASDDAGSAKTPTSSVAKSAGKAKSSATPSSTAMPPSTATTFGKRPPAPWHPLPLSEILILIGAIATVLALNNRSSDTALLIAGLIAVGIGTFEVTLREHWSGYRSHAILLALVPVLAFHSLMIGAASLFTEPTVLFSVILLPFDLALFLFLFKLLRARFLDARQLRALGRR